MSDRIIRWILDRYRVHRDIVRCEFHLHILLQLSKILVRGIARVRKCGRSQGQCPSVWHGTDAAGGAQILVRGQACGGQLLVIRTVVYGRGAGLIGRLPCRRAVCLVAPFSQSGLPTSLWQYAMSSIIVG